MEEARATRAFLISSQALLCLRQRPELSYLIALSDSSVFKKREDLQACGLTDKRVWKAVADG